MSKQRPKLGSWHTITTQANKFIHKSFEPDERCDWYPKPLKPQTAMYIGYRYKQNGKWETYQTTHRDEGWIEDVPYFQIKETVEVWMFITHENRNPIAVFPFEFEAEEQSE